MLSPGSQGHGSHGRGNGDVRVHGVLISGGFFAGHTLAFRALQLYMRTVALQGKREVWASAEPTNYLMDMCSLHVTQHTHTTPLRALNLYNNTPLTRSQTSERRRPLTVYSMRIALLQYQSKLRKPFASPVNQMLLT